MDWTKLIALLPIILQGVQVAQSIAADRKAGSGLSVTDTIQKEAPNVIGIFQQIGSALFPGVAPAQQSEAAAVVLAPDLVKQIQTALNAKGATLTVDGSYGPLTHTAVSKFQTANNLTADGWAGPLTQKALGIV